MNFKFDWGQTVVVITTAPDSMHPGQAGSVCGMRDREGIRLYLIEFSDGQALEIPEEFIHAVKDE